MIEKAKVTLEQELQYADNLAQEMREKIIADILSFVDTDVLFFRAEYPDNLIKKQNEKWNPVLEWFRKEYGVEPKITSQITPPKQDKKLAKAIGDEVRKMSGRELIAFSKTAGGFTSLILALAVMKRHISVDDAFALSRLDELFQNEMWGEDEEALNSRKLALDEVKNAMRLIDA